MENQIGLKSDYAVKMVEGLNAYLSNVQISYMNVRGYHWNITGKQFFHLHEKFEQLYNNLSEMADEIAERVLMLGGIPVHSFSKYLKLAKIKEKENVTTAEATLSEVLSEIEQLLSDERELLKVADSSGDDGTVNLLSGYISAQEKLIWMFNAQLK